jgi:hypothetical protein
MKKQDINMKEQDINKDKKLKDIVEEELDDK